MSHQGGGGTVNAMEGYRGEVEIPGQVLGADTKLTWGFYDAVGSTREAVV